MGGFIVLSLRWYLLNGDSKILKLSDMAILFFGSIPLLLIVLWLYLLISRTGKQKDKKVSSYQEQKSDVYSL